MTGSERDDLLQAAQGGLCGGCRHAEAVRSARASVFLRCRHPELPRYPYQPVIRCFGFEPRSG